MEQGAFDNSSCKSSLFVPVCCCSSNESDAQWSASTSYDIVRLPNRLVKSKMMKVLGLTYDANEQWEPLEETESGIIIASMSGYGG